MAKKILEWMIPQWKIHWNNVQLYKNLKENDNASSF